MQRYGQPPAKPPAKPPPKQNCHFILMMLLATSQILSGGMLRLRGKELLPMSEESKNTLWQTHADQHANLTLRQVQKLKNFRFCAFLWARLLGKQSSQHAGIRLQLDVLRHLMTMCIPRIWISPISMLEEPVKPAWQLTGSDVYYDPSGFMYNGRSHNWSECHHRIIAIISHPKLPWIAIMHSDGNVWIGKIGDPDGLFQLIHSPKKDNENATAIEFHPSQPIIAVAIQARIMVYRISPSLKPELHFEVSFYESGYYCPRPQFSAKTLGWNPDGTLLTAISEGKLSMCFFLKPDTIEVIGGFNGGTKYAELRSSKEVMSPSSSCFSVDGKLVMTGYLDGTLMIESAENTDKNGLTLCCLKILDKFLPGKVNRIVSDPHNHSVFAIQVKAGLMYSSVSIGLVNLDGSVTITATIPNAKSPHFHEGWLLVLREKSILFYHMNRCNIPRLVTEFYLQENGPFRVEIDTFCVKTAPNGKVMLYYSISGESKLRTAEIALS